jgi:hypothetical protein
MTWGVGEELAAADNTCALLRLAACKGFTFIFYASAFSLSCFVGNGSKQQAFARLGVAAELQR